MDIYTEYLDSMELEVLQKLLSDRRLSKIAQATGLHYNTVRNIANGKTLPSYKSREALLDYFYSEIEGAEHG